MAGKTTRVAVMVLVLALAVGAEPSGRISERDDKNYSTQVFMSMDIGATRMDETGVVEIICDE